MTFDSLFPPTFDNTGAAPEFRFDNDPVALAASLQLGGRVIGRSNVYDAIRKPKMVNEKYNPRYTKLKAR